jgi:hypothetical protein
MGYSKNLSSGIFSEWFLFTLSVPNDSGPIKLIYPSFQQILIWGYNLCQGPVLDAFLSSRKVPGIFHGLIF